MHLVCPDARFCQASSSEMFGSNINSDGLSRETTPMSFLSLYGCAQVVPIIVVTTITACLLKMGYCSTLHCLEEVLILLTTK